MLCHVTHTEPGLGSLITQYSTSDNVLVSQCSFSGNFRRRQLLVYSWISRVQWWRAVEYEANLNCNFSCFFASTVASDGSPIASCTLSLVITYRAKLLNADRLRQRAFFIITRAFLVIKRAWLLDVDWLSTPWFPASNGFWKGIAEMQHLWVWYKRGYFILTCKKFDIQQSAAFWWKSKRIFSV